MDVVYFWLVIVETLDVLLDEVWTVTELEEALPLWDVEVYIYWSGM
jgi:hypothetical protein